MDITYIIRLTKREYQVLNMIRNGICRDDVCRKLYISRRTLENHISNVYYKLEVPKGDGLYAMAKFINLEEAGLIIVGRKPKSEYIW
ncbi:helix-turn-helix transcriptional regulator [Anabaena sp. CCY 9402-a]|uniref:helix-turn-helix transcriptional regulator n=1 Tax=Anabaena sp. CCY 9402-a TaxID=3103867 RepID=UPI0039C66D23